MLVTTCAFAVQMLWDPGAQHLAGLVLATSSVSGLLGHMWLHMTMVHLVGNLVTLWIFGRYVCPRLGDAVYVLAYVAAGAVAGLVHLAYDGRPVIGASGAIMGVLGMYVVICFRQFGSLGPWLILVWFVTTLGAGIVGDFPAAYMSHAGGFLAGMILAVCLVVLRLVNVDAADPGLVMLLASTPAVTGGRDRRPRPYGDVSPDERSEEVFPCPCRMSIGRVLDAPSSPSPLPPREQAPTKLQPASAGHCRPAAYGDA